MIALVIIACNSAIPPDSNFLFSKTPKTQLFIIFYIHLFFQKNNYCLFMVFAS